MHTAESDPDDGHQFELLACAIAGREVKIADLAPGEPAWTDGVRIHLDPSTDAEERLRTVATKDLACADFPYRDGEGKYLPGVVLDLDYTVLIPRR